MLLHGQTVIDFALGEESPGMPPTADSVVPWFSVSKLPATLAFAIARAIARAFARAWARAWELGLPSPDDLVRDHLPEFTGVGRTPSGSGLCGATPRRSGPPTGPRTTPSSRAGTRWSR
ncbi:hypothetical protein [Streptomyces camelliae]|uniref:Beta-lactamase-related domain-containing protein n=1 Tax=Streptomyces camelliae TaxID=3004093 RepID=A0ABY7NUZ9_9ACTN|nr:hypothetical protein [Streptomyces sp. HUAS 2-6]WBO62045.1 hypothetical protein O1G22_03945 [Streptomyces sp. HUAS 2-6]